MSITNSGNIVKLMDSSAEDTLASTPLHPAHSAKYYSMENENVLKELLTEEAGLSESEAETRLTKFGFNRLTPKKKISAWAMYIEQFKNTLTLILIGSAIITLFVYFFGGRDPSDLIEASLILAIIIIITVLGFVQEYKAEKAVEALKQLMAYKAKVRRAGIEKEIDVSTLVPGDIVILEEGVKIPADIRLLQVFSLSVNESSLTGESTSVSKNTEAISGDKQINDQKNMVFAGTAVSSGRAVGVVITTGDKTEIGKIAQDVSETEDEETPIQKRLDEIGKYIGYVVLGICALVFVFIVFFAKDFATLPLFSRIIQSFIAAVSLAVAAIPEGLPAVVTISLALGTQRMLKRNALVRKLNSVETLGSTDVICSDKTGTLTKGEMTVREVYFDGKTYEISGTGYEKEGEFSLEGKNVEVKNLDLLLRIGLLCNNAVLDDKGKVIGDPTEAALLVSAAKAGIHEKGERVMEVPFSSERKMMSVVIKDGSDYLVMAKGAPEILLQKCSKFGDKELNESGKKEILTVTHTMSTKALRTLGFAYKKLSSTQYEESKNDEKKLEHDLIFVGVQGMIDPPRVEVKPLIEQCHTSGIRVIMITGDHVETAKAVAKEIGIVGDALTGEELDTLSDEQLLETVEKVSVYARVNPSFKMRIVDALKKDGHIVAMTGDGVNDAPALKKADIGIAMGITGTDVAKEASDMVLLDDHFSTIVSAIEEGRGIFHNIRKFVDYLLSCNIAEVLVVFIAVIFFQKLPLTATMLLWINVVTDGIPAVALGLDKAERGILNLHPKVFQSQIVTKRLWVEMFIFGFMLTAAVLGIYLWDLREGLEQAQGAAFMAIVVFELVNLYIIRSGYKTPFFSNKWLFISVIVTLLLQIGIIYIPFISRLFEVDNINLYDWIYIIVMSGVLWGGFKLVQKFFDMIHFMDDRRLSA